MILNGLSFRQADMDYQSTRLIVSAAGLRDITESFVRKSVRSTVAINLQKMRDLPTQKPCWEFSIAFDTAFNSGDDYFDLRL